MFQIICVGILAPITNMRRIFAPQNLGAFEVHLVELWSLRSVPRVVLGPCNVCPQWSFWSNAKCAPLFHGGQNIHKKSSKTQIAPISQGYFCKPLSFQRSIHSLGLIFKGKKKYFCYSTFNAEYRTQQCYVQFED